MRRFVVLSLALSVLAVSNAPAVSSGLTSTGDGNGVSARFFESRIRPLLAENCLTCHGARSARGGVRLDSREALLDARGGPVVVPGKAAESRLIRAVLYDGPIKMPPACKLDAASIRVLTQWVQEGAFWPAAAPGAESAGKQPSANGEAAISSRFWSFQPVREPVPPAVVHRHWAKSPIDRFILAKLEQTGRDPAPKADRRTLLRRATYDLTGLPPTLSEMSDFLADRSADAFAKVVDRLLESPRYGERWGRHWLDVVRYCDSLDSRGLGGEGDISEAWRYRDWVIDAFNRDLPYNEFIINQIAGDLLPAPKQGPVALAPQRRPERRLGAAMLTSAAETTVGATRRTAEAADDTGNVPAYLKGAGHVNAAGIIATGMLAIGNWGNGDADKEKILTDIADDQVDVISRGFMGLTVACARCHDHKFDPIPTRDYYGLAGIFFSTHILPGLAAKGSGETPLRIPLLSPSELEHRSLQAERAEKLEKQLKAAVDRRAAELVRSMLPRTAEYLIAARDCQLAPGSLSEYARRHRLEEMALRRWVDYLFGGGYRLMKSPVRDLLGNVGVHAWRGEGDTPNVTVNTNDSPRTILTFTLPPRSVSVHPGPTNGVVVGWKSPISGTVKITGGVKDADPACGDGIAWIIDHRERLGYEQIASGEFPNGGEQLFSQGAGGGSLQSVPVKAGEMIQLLVLPKMTYACDTTVVQLTITEQGGEHRWDIQEILDDFHEGGNPHPDHYRNGDVWHFYDMADSSRITHRDGDTARQLWLKAAASGGELLVKASAEFAKSLTAVDSSSPFWTTDPGAFSPEHQRELAKLQSELDSVKKSLAVPIIYANGAQEGGVPGSPQAGFHDVRIHIRGSYARLGEVAPRHFPLVLGGAAAPPIREGSGRLELARWIASPSHPLTARVMVNRIWQHHFGEAIVRTPGNFGKLGERPTHPELLDYLASQFVKSGWSMKKMHRMIMLSATYQQSSLAPAASRRKDADNRLFSRMNRQRLDAEELRDTLLATSGKLDVTSGGPAVKELSDPRRTVYLMTIRSDRSGFRSLFDAADPTSIVDKRTVSTVAPQALFLLNSPFARDCAQQLAHRLVREMGRDDVGRIHRAHQLLYGRPALQDEIILGRRYLERARQNTGNEDAATADDRAWAAFSQILLSANELIYVD